MEPGATAAQIGTVILTIQKFGGTPHTLHNDNRTVIAGIGLSEAIEPGMFTKMVGVERVSGIHQPYKLASREIKTESTVINVEGAAIGGETVIIIAGPCSVESRQQLLETAWAVKEAGAKILRGGAFKPRTSPYSFQGLGLKGLELLAEAREATGLPVITEAMTPEMVPLVAEYADILQIGARNMQNYGLLHAVGRIQKPVMLKRGMMSDVQELLMAAEYILSGGNYQVMLCERGIRTFNKMTRNTFDLAVIPLLKQLTHLPVIADPSHATGRWDLIAPMSRAAIAAGADGLMVEVHPRPEEALSDGPQSLKPERFARMMTSLQQVAQAVGRSL